MKLQLDIRNEPKINDLLIYDGKEWIPISKERLLKDIPIIYKQLEEMNDKLNETLEKINKKLKDYHNILQNLTKGE